MAPSTKLESRAELARALWRAVEPLHTLVYFAPEGPPIYVEIRLREGWMPYFASRAAALGPVHASVVTALFYSFHPGLVARSIPAAWELAAPAEALAARLRVADAAIHRQYPGIVGAHATVKAAELARRATEGCDAPGRALYGAHAGLEWPGEAHLQLWWAATLLREHRGDGHVAGLLSAGIEPCPALVLHEASGDVPAGYLRKARGWSEDEWATATEALQGRGWLDGEGAMTDTGRNAREQLERRTDELAAGPVDELGAEGCGQLLDLVAELLQ